MPKREECESQQKQLHRKEEPMRSTSQGIQTGAPFSNEMHQAKWQRIESQLRHARFGAFREISKNFTASVWQFRTAADRAVLPLELSRERLAFASSNICITTMLPLDAAACNGVSASFSPSSNEVPCKV